MILNTLHKLKYASVPSIFEFVQSFEDHSHKIFCNTILTLEHREFSIQFIPLVVGLRLWLK